MGVPKQVLPFGGTTMVGEVVDAALQSQVADVVVVTGFHHREVEDAVGPSVRIAHNPDAASGNMSSLLVGLDAAGHVDGVVILLSDMPEVTSDTIDALVEGVVERGARAGWAEYTTGTAHPVALTAESFPEIRRLRGPKALWSFLDSLGEGEVYALSVAGPKPIDVNTEGDYEELIRRVQGRSQHLR